MGKVYGLFLQSLFICSAFCNFFILCFSLFCFGCVFFSKVQSFFGFLFWLFDWFQKRNPKQMTVLLRKGQIQNKKDKNTDKKNKMLIIKRDFAQSEQRTLAAPIRTKPLKVHAHTMLYYSDTLILIRLAPEWATLQNNRTKIKTLFSKMTNNES